MSNINTIYASGTSIIFNKTDDDSPPTQFSVMVVPNKDQYNKKDIIATTDSSIITKGILKRPINNSKEVIQTFSEWSKSDPECIAQLSDFLNHNLDKKELKEKKKTISGKVSPNGVEAGYTQKEKY